MLLGQLLGVVQVSEGSHSLLDGLSQCLVNVSLGDLVGILLGFRFFEHLFPALDCLEVVQFFVGHALSEVSESALAFLGHDSEVKLVSKCLLLLCVLELQESEVAVALFTHCFQRQFNFHRLYSILFLLLTLDLLSLLGDSERLTQKFD